MFRPPGDCPVCSEFVPRGYHACPYCSADERSGWKEEDSCDGLGLRDEDFNYEDFLKNEFGNSSPSHKLHPLWWITGVILLILSVIGLLVWSTDH